MSKIALLLLFILANKAYILLFITIYNFKILSTDFKKLFYIHIFYWDLFIIYADLDNFIVLYIQDKSFTFYGYLITVINLCTWVKRVPYVSNKKLTEHNINIKQGNNFISICIVQMINGL